MHPISDGMPAIRFPDDRGYMAVDLGDGFFMFPHQDISHPERDVTPRETRVQLKRSLVVLYRFFIPAGKVISIAKVGNYRGR